MVIKFNYKVLNHQYEFTFKISSGAKDTTQTVLVELEYEHQGRLIKAFGEAVFTKYNGEALENVLDFYCKINEAKLLDDLDPMNLQELESRLNHFEEKHNHKSNQAAKAGIDIAFWDLRAKIFNLPLYKLFFLDKKLCPKTSYTIGLADLETIKSKTQTALSRGYDILKVKLGSKDDVKIVETIRELAPNALIRVDANAAWEVNDALNLFEQIKPLNIEFVEEPLKLGSKPDDYKKLYEHSPLPVMADESCHTTKDLKWCSENFHSINIKHTKSGGITETLRMIHTAKALNLKIMLGGFGESTISVAAFAHISPLVDYADLDASLLLKDEPFGAIEFEGSNIILKDSPGLGYQE